MAVVSTTVARVSNWQTFAHLNQETLLGRAREVGATRYRIYRNVRDASLALIVSELPDSEAAQELDLLCAEHLSVLLSGCDLDAGIWEATSLEGIG
jgi:hypothetical protein